MISEVIFSKFGFVRVVLVALALIVLVSGPAKAQVTGARMTGAVRDASGAVVPNAQILIRDVSTGEARTVTSNSDGVYSAPNLVAGTYDVTVTAPGFSTLVQTGITLTVGAQQEVNLTLQLGELSQKVEVTAEAVAVDLVNATVGGVVESGNIVELPLNGRDWTSLATLQPGVTSAASLQQIGINNKGNRGFGNQLSIAGGRTGQNGYLIDGIHVEDALNSGPGGVSGQTLGVDDVAEFSVLTSNYSAEYGRTSGGVVNAVTSSGGNRFHGDAYEFLRNSALDARNYFDGPSIPPFRRNQFGGSAGGPIKKDRAFVFGDYEGLRQALSTTTPDIVPSAWVQQNGTFCNAPVATPTCPTLASLTPVDPAVLPYLHLWPTPPGPAVQPTTSITNQVGPGFNTDSVSIVGNQILTENFYAGRFDYKFSDKDSFFASYQYDHGEFFGPDSLHDISVAYQSGRQLIALEETHIFTPQLVNSIRFGVNRNTQSTGFGSTAINPLAAEISLGSVPGANAPTINVPGLQQFIGGVNVPNQSKYPFTAYQAFDDLFFTKGIHSFKFGFSVERDQNNELLRSSAGGSFSFTSLSSFLTNGSGGSFRASLPGFPIHPRGLRESIYGGYIQDDVHLRPNLTINLGLRYEMSTALSEVHNELFVLPSPSATAVRLGSPIFTNPTHRNFEPRIGFAWDPFHDGKTSVRGGFGMFDVLPLFSSFATPEGQQGPDAPQGSASHLPVDSFPTGAYLRLKASSTRVFYVEQDPHRNYVMQWNMSVEHELTSSLSATIAYVGSHGVHMVLSGDGDFVQPTLTSSGYLWPQTLQSLPNTSFGQIGSVVWAGNSAYNGLQLRLTQRLSHGLQVGGSYTWSRSIDEQSSSETGDQFANSVVDAPFLSVNPLLARGPSDLNLTHNLVINYEWLIPTPGSFHGVEAWAAGGWQVGGIFTAHSGSPFTPYIAGDPLGENNASPWANPDRVPGCKLTTGNPSAYINLACFTLPVQTLAVGPAQCAPFTNTTIPFTCSNLMGLAGRNEIYGPGFVDLDFSLFKNNYIRRISESFNVQFRAELFNVLNHPNFLPPIDNSTLFNQDGSPVGGAGKIDLTANNSRQVQFGIKVIW